MPRAESNNVADSVGVSDRCWAATRHLVDRTWAPLGHALWAGLIICELGACNDVRKPAEELVFAVRELRDASQTDKPAQLQKLRELPCDGEALCSFQSQCVVAYETHLGATARVATLRAAPTPDSVEGVQALRQDLAEVEANLHQARELAQSCLKREGELVEKFKL